MKKTRKNMFGFAHHALLGLVVVAIITFAGYKVLTGTHALTTAGKTWNVTPTGTGNSSLLTAETYAQPGDTISLSGTWKNVTLLPKVSGTASAPITYKSTTGATFDGAGQYGVANTAGRSYLVFDGITFANSNYISAPVANKGVIVRNSNHITFMHDNFSHMQMQLIGSSYSTISDNTWNQFVAVYTSGKPQTSGDMLAILLGSHDNQILRNDMQYAGHSLISVGNGIGNTDTNANNLIDSNKLSNPWYKDLILSDNGAGTTASNNQILDANSVPTLTSTVLGQQGTLQTSSSAVQFSGENFTLTGNTIKNAVATYGVIDIGSRYYPGPPSASVIESMNNKITNNVFSNNKGAAVFGFVVFQAPTDPITSTPRLTGNVISSNTLSGNSSSQYAQFKTYTPFLYHAATVATPWTGFNGNQVTNNTVDSSAQAYLSDATYNGKTTHQIMSLTQFNTFDLSHVYGNHL